MSFLSSIFITSAGAILVQIIFRHPCRWDFMAVASLLFLVDMISQQTPCSSGLYQPLCRLLLNGPESSVQELFCRCISWGCTSALCILIGLWFSEMGFVCLWCCFLSGQFTTTKGESHAGEGQILTLCPGIMITENCWEWGNWVYTKVSLGKMKLRSRIALCAHGPRGMWSP